MDKNNINKYKVKEKEWRNKKKEFKQSGGRFTKGDIAWIVRRDEEADSYYEHIRNRSDDIKKIAKNTGWTEEKITQIKNHVFFNKHILRDGSIGLLDSDYNMAVAWQRLINGEYEDTDILLLNHEYLESCIEKKYNLPNLEAHRMTEKEYDWYKEILKKKGEFGEDDCLNELIRKE